MIAALLLLFATLTTARDAYCIRADGVSVGVVLAGTEVEVLDQENGQTLIYSERHKSECWINDKAFQEPSLIHPEYMAQVLKWRTLVQRWLPTFPDTLTEELVLSVIYKETGGDPHAVDQTGNDMRLVGEASVGVMGAIPRVNLPCYEELTGENGKDEYACQIFLGMTILDAAIRRAHELNGGKVDFAYQLGILPSDRECVLSNGTPVGWLVAGEEIKVTKVYQNAAGEVTAAMVLSERHGRSCIVSLEGVDLSDKQEVEDPEFTQEDIALGLELYGCTEKNVLADNCLPWGGETYSDKVLEQILPEIVEELNVESTN